jgi:hypothetical protein
MWNRTYYAVETKHPVNGSRWDGQHVFRVCADGDRYYAESDNFGCGKSYDTPDGAIAQLVHDNGAVVLNLRYQGEDKI